MASRPNEGRGLAPLPIFRPAPPAPRPPRPRPDDFAAAYIAFGYDECEVIFRASLPTIKRWIREAGPALRAARAEYVRQERLAKRKAGPPASAFAPAVDDVAVDAGVLSEAANWLRTMRNGGWFCAPTGQGDWWLGTNRRTPAQIVDFAARKGFDLDSAKLRCMVEAGNA